jgi:bacterioferritin-associated ferredoxin
MIVCVCNRISESEVRETASKGARTPEAAYAQFDCEAQCGCCLDYAQEIIDEARHRTLLALKEFAEEEVTDPSVLKAHIRKALGKYFFEVTKRKPVIVPVIMEV